MNATVINSGAYLSSVNKCRELTGKIAGDASTSLSEEETLSDCRSLTSDEIPADCRRHLQKSWLQPIFQNTKDALMVKPEETALIAGVSSKGAGDWPNAFPSSTAGVQAISDCNSSQIRSPGLQSTQMCKWRASNERR